MSTTFQIKKVFQKVPLNQYAREYGEECVEVWANPTRNIRREREELMREYQLRIVEVLRGDNARQERLKTADDKESERILREAESARDAQQAWLDEFNERMCSWYAKVWRFDGSAMEPAEILAMHEQDPRLVNWLSDRTAELIEARAKAEKNA